jgi:hypothetical protein
MSYEDERIFRKIQLRKLSEQVKGNIRMNLGRYNERAVD